MFKHKNSNKLSPQARFQTVRFKQKLEHQARGPRTGFRPPKIIRLRWFLVSCLALVLVILIGLGLYQVFQIKEITILGVDSTRAQQISDVVSQSVNPKFLAFLHAKPNLLFVTGDFSRQLLDHNVLNLANISVEKKYPHTLVISVQPYEDWYAVVTPQGKFLLDSSGKVQELKNGSVKDIIYNSPITFKTGESVIDRQLLSNLHELLQLLEHKATKIESVELLVPKKLNLNSSSSATTTQSSSLYEPVNLKPTEAILSISKAGVAVGAKLYVSLEQSPKITTEQFLLFVDSQDPARLSQLAYLDLRFGSRGYACLKGSVCSAVDQMK